jgi:hypothetical protein
VKLFTGALTWYLLNISGQPPCRKPILRLYSRYDEAVAG